MTTETGANPGGGTNPTAGRGPGGPGGTGPGIGSAGRGGRGGRGNNRSHNRGQTNPQAIAAAAARKRAAAFKGEDPDMAGHVFTCFNEAADPKQFDKTLAALERYSAKSLKHPGDMSPIFEDQIEVHTPTDYQPGHCPS